ncbi:hypothetical protein KTH71_03840 [Acinetobacter sp. WU_MDCI_Axc73]|nr:hypothetical protein [Acinetobacter sp. WU_MDCI_Axc73]
MKILNRTLVIALSSTCFLTACHDDDDNDVAQITPPPALTDCMWHDGVTSKSHTGEDAMNFAYPDTNVNYYTSQFSIPDGARVFVDGDFPYSRHMSLVSYESNGTRVNSLLDAEIQPNTGVTNPFVVGNKRLEKERGYSTEIKIGNLPAKPEKNTLYAPPTNDNSLVIWYRVYVPNEGYDNKGGVEFPHFRVVTKEGKEIKGQEVCQFLNVKDKPVQNYNAFSGDIVQKAFSRQLYPGFPAQLTPTWYAARNGTANAQCAYKIGIEKCEGLTPERKLNFWATPDNEYVFATTSRRIGKVLLLNGKLPKIASTQNNEAVLGAGDLRYMSICTNEITSTATNYCLYDGDLSKNLDAEGKYKIIVSLPEDRPKNATEECGYKFLALSPRGSGLKSPVGEDYGHEDFGLLIMRNLLPYPGFNQAVQNTLTWGDEKSIMGDYLPTIQYLDQNTIDNLECKH